MKTRIYLIIIITALFLVSCGAVYTDSLGAYELALLGRESIDSEAGMRWLEDDALLEFSDYELPFLADYALARSNDAKNINEIGIFKVKGEHREQMYEIVDRYVKNKQKAYRAMNYFPEEAEKVEAARVRAFGNYVIYSFLNDKDTKAFYKSIEDALKQ